MKTFKAICIQDFIALDTDGNFCHIERGKEYDISEEACSPALMAKDIPPEIGMVTVFTNYWIKAPIDIFAGIRSGGGIGR